MLSWHFSYNPKSEADQTPFEKLFEVFQQLMYYTSGDVDEALTWLTELDKQYDLTTPEYGISDFIEDLKAKGYIKDTGDGNALKNYTPTNKLEISLRRNALDEIFDQLKKSKRGDHKTNFSGNFPAKNYL